MRGAILSANQISAGLCLAFCMLWPYAAAAQDTNPIEIALVHQTGDAYVPGESLEVIVSIETTAPGELTALGLYETVPSGWSLETIQPLSGALPDLRPDPGATGVLQFVWITPPQLPLTFGYRLAVPETERGLRILSGQVEYRQLAGRLLSAPVLTRIEGPENHTPKIALLGPNPMQLEVGEPFIEPGYRAQDDEDGDLTNQVQVTGRVDSTRAGMYTLRYAVSDQDGLAGDPVERSVRVQAVEGTSAPAGGSAAPEPMETEALPPAPSPPAEIESAAAPETPTPVAGNVNAAAFRAPDPLPALPASSTGDTPAASPGDTAEKTLPPPRSMALPPKPLAPAAAQPDPPDKPHPPAPAGMTSAPARPSHETPAAINASEEWPADVAIPALAVGVTEGVHTGMPGTAAQEWRSLSERVAGLKQMPPRQAGILGVVLAGMAALGVLGFVAWRIAYKTPSWRKPKR